MPKSGVIRWWLAVAEYIKREDALTALSKSGVTCNMRAYKIVAALPAADVAEVRHGRWELRGNDDDLGSSYFCSVCHFSVDEDWFYKHGEFSPFKHCPECTARMDKEDEHEVLE